MSLSPQQLAFSAAPATADHRSSSKRKLDDYAASFDDDEDDPDFSDLVTVRMRKDESLLAVHSSSSLDHNSCDNSNNTTRVSDANSSVCSCSFSPSPSSPLAGPSGSRRIQFFVRMIVGGKSICIQADADDTVKSVHERLRLITGIPLIEQRLIYKGKQLQWEESLADSAIENDSGLQLVGRMRSTRHPRTCQLINDMVSTICRLCKTVLGDPDGPKHIKKLMAEFFTLTPSDSDDASGHLQVFMTSSVPAALVTLYVSPMKGNKECAESCIKQFLSSCKDSLPKTLYTQCSSIVLEFCKLLRKVGCDDPLYLFCRGALGSLLENAGGMHTKYSGGGGSGEDVRGLMVMQEIFPFVSELAGRLSSDLVSTMDSPMNVGPLSGDVRDFSAFLHPLQNAITEQVGYRLPISMPLNKKGFSHPLYAAEIRKLHTIFKDLLDTMSKCLRKMEDSLLIKLNAEAEPTRPGWSQYLAILKELNTIGRLYKGAEEHFWMVLEQRKVSICALIVKFAKRIEDHKWILRHKEVTDFESRRHLIMMMFPEVKEDYEELHEMLIDRSQLLSESFEYIGRAESEALHGGLFMEFKNEEATGPGVLREWFFLVVQAIFDPQNALFVACPNDRRRFFPNPASKVDPMHLEYFTFSGRVIALALMHKVQVGVVLDRVFFLQLAGFPISLEDIRDADPCLYSSCKQILEMDAEFIDSDALGLTFVREVEELGSRTVVELRPGGKGVVVNSKNREEYVNLLIRHRFVASIYEQVSHFAKGFADILSDSGLQNQEFFFRSLELEDLDWMLYGSESAICVEDWKAHTEYNGYKESDPQISWFWKVVGEMTAEQRKVLLFFWTSVKYLPVEGFRGLASRLYIYKTPEPHDRLPSSHTCFYRLCFPPYPSVGVMQDRLNVITQEHVGCSFGTW